MRRPLRVLLAATAALFAAATAFAVTLPADAAPTLTRVTNFGANPTNLAMYVHVPATRAARPALLVMVHHCQGNATSIANGVGRDFLTAADKHGFVVVLPEATRSGTCFDVSTSKALVRGGGSDSTGIMSMVGWARAAYGVDPSRIAVTGFSSGAMMTNLLAAQYPDVFSAASAFSGVPAGCFATTGGSLWNSDCAQGRINRTPQQWAAVASAMYPGYTGRYPRMQLWHGTADTTLHYRNFGEAIEQWTELHRVSQTPARTDQPQYGWTRTRYGSTGTRATVEGVSIAGAGHGLPGGLTGYAVSFLGLDAA